MNDQIKRRYWLLIIIGMIVMFVGVVLMVISPIIVTQNTSKYDFTQTGQIGDTIGGITAPIAAIFGSILIFISFLEQWKANKQQWLMFEKKNMEELYLKRIEYLKNDLKNEFEKDSNLFQNLNDVLHKSDQEISKEQFFDFVILNLKKLILINHYTVSILKIVDDIKKDTTLPQPSKEFMLDNLYYIFSNYFSDSFFVYSKRIESLYGMHNDTETTPILSFLKKHVQNLATFLPLINKELRSRNLSLQTE